MQKMGKQGYREGLGTRLQKAKILILVSVSNVTTLKQLKEIILKAVSLSENFQTFFFSNTIEDMHGGKYIIVRHCLGGFYVI